jgi:hypothetical protein
MAFAPGMAAAPKAVLCRPQDPDRNIPNLARQEFWLAEPSATQVLTNWVRPINYLVWYGRLTDADNGRSRQLPG